MSNQIDFLREEYTIDTPENVTFGYEIAGIGSRFIGTLVDTIILVIALIVLNLVIGVLLVWFEGAEKVFSSQSTDDMGWIGGLVLALYALLNFALFWGYYIIFEWLWNGQTPGKRIAKVRVVRLDGNPAGFIEIVVRNLVRVIDFLPSAYGIGLLTMFFNQQTRRLGDFAAGTLVIKDRADIGLTNLGRVVTRQQTPLFPATSPEAEALWQRFPNLRRLSAADIDLIQDALNRYTAGKIDRELLRRLATAIAAKLEISEIPQDGRLFLNEIAEAYRRAG